MVPHIHLIKICQTNLYIWWRAVFHLQHITPWLRAIHSVTSTIIIAISPIHHINNKSLHFEIAVLWIYIIYETTNINSCNLILAWYHRLLLFCLIAAFLTMYNHHYYSGTVLTKNIDHCLSQYCLTNELFTIQILPNVFTSYIYVDKGNDGSLLYILTFGCFFTSVGWTKLHNTDNYTINLWILVIERTAQFWFILS